MTSTANKRGLSPGLKLPLEAFRDVWERINAPGSWERTREVPRVGLRVVEVRNAHV